MDSEPDIIGYYSVNNANTYLPDCSELSYYNPPPLGPVSINLTKELVINGPEPTNDANIRRLLQWIKDNRANILPSKPEKWIEPDFVCMGGELSNIMRTPFQQTENNWTICAAKWKGTIYLSRFTRRRPINSPTADPSKDFLAQGIKFAHSIVSDHPDKSPDASRPVYKCAEFRCIYKRRFGNHVVLFSDQKSAFVSETVLEDPLNLNNVRSVDLHTTIVPTDSKSKKTFQQSKVFQWWIKSFVGGTNNVLCGFQNLRHIVFKLKSYSLDEMIKEGQSYWNPQTCIEYVENFLNDVASTVVEECDKTIYTFMKKPYNDYIEKDQVSPTSTYAFIPESFLEATR